MFRLTIDNQPVEVPPGSTILDAARKLSIDIPTLCFRDGCEPSTSCLACVVRINNQERLVPSCATQAEDGMQVQSETEEIHRARRTALELLLSDHLGDCLGPCRTICPAGMNIPLMIRQIAGSDFRDAIITVKRDIALPAVLGRICSAPCEKGCRRKEYDDAVAICLLKRYVADVDLARNEPYLPELKDKTGKKTAIVGAGPAGLTAAYYLRQEGIACTIFDDHEKPGGMLRYAVPEEKLPQAVLAKEIALIEKLGVRFKLSTRIGRDIEWSDIRNEFDAVLIATGEIKPDKIEILQLETDKNGLKVNKKTNQTSLPSVFAAGNVVHPGKMAVRTVAAGKAAAVSITQYLSGQAVTGTNRLFNVHIGRLRENEINKFMVGVSTEKRTDLQNDSPEGMTDDQARGEALRCLHCDCRKYDTCKLRIYAEKYRAWPRRYKQTRPIFEQNLQHPDIIFEPGKCINCGLCVQIAAAA
ncbi:MAG: (2Fe-2S)-binding protein, partial [Sedimentisphaerales bacterium]|nr:(2Fe-2S)-binding protein [Sedimentisphaerales bacterium]